MTAHGRALALLLPLLACGDDADAAPRPSDEPASAPAALELPLDGLEPGPPSDHAAPAAPTPQPLSPGQWARYGATWREGGRSFLTYRVVGAQDGAYRIEVDDQRRQRRTLIEMLVRIPDPRDASQAQIVDVRIHDGSSPEVQRIPPRLLGMYGPILQQFLTLMLSDWRGRPQEDVQVPAGRFAQAYAGEQRMLFAGRDATGRVWHHPDVPVTGLVRFQAEGDAHVLELIGFGQRGARGVMPPDSRGRAR